MVIKNSFPKQTFLSKKLRIYFKSLLEKENPVFLSYLLYFKRSF